MPAAGPISSAPGVQAPFFTRMGIDELIGLMLIISLFSWYAWPALAAWLLYARWRRGLTLAELAGAPRFSRIDWRPLWVVPFAAMFSAGAVWLVFLPLSRWYPDYVEHWLNEQSAIEQLFTLGNPAFALLLIVVAFPLVEEIAFRGLMLRKLDGALGRRAAMVASALLFAVLHAEWLGHFVIGIVFCLLYFRGGLWLAAAGHMLNNLLALLIASMDQDWTGNAPAFYPLASFQADWWVGALLLLASVPAVLFFIVRHGTAVADSA